MKLALPDVLPPFVGNGVSAYRWLLLSQSIGPILSVVSTSVKLVIGLAPLKWNICSPRLPPAARNAPDGEIDRLAGRTGVDGIVAYVSVVVRLQSGLTV
jgi:hypothetical protein